MGRADWIKKTKGGPMKILLDTGSGITPISEGLAAELQENISGVKLTQPSLGPARVRTVFGQEHTISRKTAPCSDDG